jgi:predicted Rossmann fold flavoprotein
MRVMPGDFDVAVLGGGAAGLMCAAEAGKRGRSALVIEHNAVVGRKILISGGGRCNFTNTDTAPSNFISANPHFAKSALARYGPAEFIRLVEKHRIPFHEKKLGQLFCDRSAQDILSMLESECCAAGVVIAAGTRIEDVAAGGEGRRFSIRTSGGAVSASSLVVATGGLSIPKMGATDLGYKLAGQFGLAIRTPRPALVPLQFGSEDRARFHDLQGVSTAVMATVAGRRFTEAMLFTHSGLSGPAILQASTYWLPGEAITLDLMPGIDFAGLLAERRSSGDAAEIRTIAGRILPARLAARWFELLGISGPVCGISDRTIEQISSSLRNWNFIPGGTEGFTKAEVTAGGIDTAGLSSKTFESRRVPGLYYIGEVVDVTGHLGGFNFQWAWSSGWAAGQYV